MKILELYRYQQVKFNMKLFHKILLHSLHTLIFMGKLVVEKLAL
jgi:hypothetical protein